MHSPDFAKKIQKLQAVLLLSVKQDNPVPLPCCCLAAAVQAVIRESLRLSPPGWMTSREAAADITLPNGLFLPQGTVCYIDIWGIQRDPDYWQDPEAFQPERFLDKVG